MYPPHSAPFEDSDRNPATVPAPKPVRYRLRPIEFDVRQVPLDLNVDIEEIREWCGGRIVQHDGVACIEVNTVGPIRVARPGDHILKQASGGLISGKGEVYVVRDEDFRLHYEKVLGYR